jgi:hypothetical protein
MSLEKELEEFDRLLAMHVKKSAKAELRWVTCKSVNWAKKTMVATGIGDEGEYLDVMLGMGSQYRKPKSKTKCLIALTEWEETRCILLFCEECELEENNGGDNGGLVKIEKLIERINRLEDKLKNHQHAYIPYPSGSPGPPVLTTPASSAAPPDVTLVFNNTTKQELEDEKITH